MKNLKKLLSATAFLTLSAVSFSSAPEAERTLSQASYQSAYQGMNKAQESTSFNYLLSQSNQAEIYLLFEQLKEMKLANAQREEANESLKKIEAYLKVLVMLNGRLDVEPAKA